MCSISRKSQGIPSRNYKENHLLCKGTVNLSLWYLCDDNFELTGYADVDYTGCKVDRKSTSGTCQFLESKLISWFSKKQTSVATSTIKAEYMAAGSCYAQILWLKQQLKDYKILVSNVPIFCRQRFKMLCRKLGLLSLT